MIMLPFAKFGNVQRRHRGALPAAHSPSGLAGFTLIELLVVVAIISLFVSILLPSLNRAKELGRRTVCSTNLKQIGLGMVMYAQDQHKKEYPPFSASHWPCGYYCTEPGTITEGGHYYYYCPGFKALTPDYISSTGVFFCPSNKYFTQEHWWPSLEIRRSYAGYCYWANSEDEDLTDDVVATGPTSSGDTVLASDIMTKDKPSWNSHIQEDFQGGSVLYNDTHVEWVNGDQTELGRTLLSTYDFWF